MRRLSPLLAAGLVLALVIAAAAIAAPWLSPHDAFAQSAAERLSAPDGVHVLGRDSFGRDVFARVMLGGRISLVVGVGSVALAAAIGMCLGTAAGFAGGKLEQVLMRALDVLMAFPSLLLGLAVVAVVGSGAEKLILAIGLVLAPSFARVVHAATLSLRRREFVEAARSLGASHARILARHVVPNLLDDVVVLASLLVASAIRIEASMSFIGLGVPPPSPTWGNMIREGVPLLFSAPWLSVFPGVAILLAVLAFNVLGDGVRDAFDPHA